MKEEVVEEGKGEMVEEVVVEEGGGWSEGVTGSIESREGEMRVGGAERADGKEKPADM